MTTNKFILNIEKALDEKRQMAKIFEREHGYRSYVLDILIEHFEGLKQG